MYVCVYLHVSLREFKYTRAVARSERNAIREIIRRRRARREDGRDASMRGYIPRGLASAREIARDALASRMCIRRSNYSFLFRFLRFFLPFLLFFFLFSPNGKRENICVRVQISEITPKPISRSRSITVLPILPIHRD